MQSQVRNFNRIAKALGVRLEYLDAHSFKNRYEFAYIILENRDMFGYNAREIDGVPIIVKDYGTVMDCSLEFIRD